jgi:hypothetical protein
MGKKTLLTIPIQTPSIKRSMRASHAGMADQLVSRYSIDIGSVSHTEHTHNVWRVGVTAAFIAIVWAILFVFIFARYGAVTDNSIDRKFEYLCQESVSVFRLSGQQSGVGLRCRSTYLLKSGLMRQQDPFTSFHHRHKTHQLCLPQVNFL